MGVRKAFFTIVTNTNFFPCPVSYKAVKAYSFAPMPLSSVFASCSVNYDVFLLAAFFFYNRVQFLKEELG